MWLSDSGQPGPSVVISFGVPGTERPPIAAGMALVGALEPAELFIGAGRLLLVHANPRATEEDRRWSEGGVDLNRCFSNDSLGAAPVLYEQERAREIAAALEQFGADVLVDFHCTV